MSETFSEEFVGPWERMYLTRRSTEAAPKVDYTLYNETTNGWNEGRRAAFAPYPYPSKTDPILQTYSRDLWRHGRWWASQTTWYNDTGGIPANLPPSGTPFTPDGVSSTGNVSTHFTARAYSWDNSKLDRIEWSSRGYNLRMASQDRTWANAPGFNSSELEAEGAIGVQYWTPELDPTYDGNLKLIYDKFVVHGWRETWTETTIRRKADVLLFVRLNATGTPDLFMPHDKAGFSASTDWIQVPQGQDTVLPVSWLHNLMSNPAARIEIGFVHDKVYYDQWPGDHMQTMTWNCSITWDASVSYYTAPYRFIYPEPPPLTGGLRRTDRAFVG